MNFAEIFSIRKQIAGLSCGVVCVILRLAVSVEHRLVIDRQTGRQTHDDGIYCASIELRGKKTFTLERCMDQKPVCSVSPTWITVAVHVDAGGHGVPERRQSAADVGSTAHLGRYRSNAVRRAVVDVHRAATVRTVVRTTDHQIYRRNVILHVFLPFKTDIFFFLNT